MAKLHSNEGNQDCSDTEGADIDLNGMNPREVLEHIMPGFLLSGNMTDRDVLGILVQMLSEPGRRDKLPQYNTFDDVLELIRNSQRIIVLTGAGVSVSCGIPDFRSKDGIYARLHVDFPDLPDPQAMFDIDYFRKNPKPFFDFAKEIYPGKFTPSLCHRFVKVLEQRDQLLRNYTQNIDTLEQITGIQRVVQCHGSFATASCCQCKFKVDSEYIKNDIMEKKVPLCPHCSAESGFNVLKPEITFFGEPLSQQFHDSFDSDKSEADLLIVIGSSMKVRPVSLIPNSLSANVPQILINREPLSHLNFDVELLGNCDDIVNEICRRLGPPWDTVCQPDIFPALTEISAADLSSASSSTGATRIDARESSPVSTATPDSMKDAKTEQLKSMYKPRLQKLSSCLKDHTYLFMPPNRYVFKGAEVFRDYPSSSSSSSSSDTESCEGDQDESMLSPQVQQTEQDVKTAPAKA